MFCFYSRCDTGMRKVTASLQAFTLSLNTEGRSGWELRFSVTLLASSHCTLEAKANMLQNKSSEMLRAAELPQPGLESMRTAGAQPSPEFCSHFQQYAA